LHFQPYVGDIWRIKLKILWYGSVRIAFKLLVLAGVEKPGFFQKLIQVFVFCFFVFMVFLWF